MSLAIFGLVLLAGTVGLCWKNGRAITTAVLAVMLGMVMAGSNGALKEPTESLISGIRSGLTSVGTSMFGGAK